MPKNLRENYFYYDSDYGGYFHFPSKQGHLWSSLHLLNPSFFLPFLFLSWCGGVLLKRIHSYHYFAVGLWKYSAGLISLPNFCILLCIALCIVCVFVFVQVKWSASIRLRGASRRFHLYSFPLHLWGGMEIWKLPIVSNVTSKECCRKKRKNMVMATFSFIKDTPHN